MTSTVRDGFFGCLVIVAIVALFVGGAIVVKGPDRWLTHQQGPKPRLIEHGSEPCGIVENGCTTFRHSWTVTDGLTVVYRLDGLFESWLRWDGTLDALIQAVFRGSCTGAEVNWSVRADARTIVSGTLSSAPGRRATMRGATVPAEAETITLTVGWKHRPPGCTSFALNWDDPEVNTGLA